MNITNMSKYTRILLNLAFDDFKARYGNSVLGTAWMLINPVLMVLVFWFVFRVGFRIGASRPDLPFVVWFSAGLIPWLCFSECLGGASGSVIQYSYLIRKQAFPIGIIPAIKIATAFLAHLVFLVILFVIMVLTQTPFTEQIIKLPYFMFCLIAISLGSGYISASITPFFRDWSQIIGIVLQFGTWLTPIMWPWTMVPPGYNWILYINPMAYVVEGYRTALFGGTVLENAAEPATILPPHLWIAFWGAAILFLWCGYTMYHKLRPHFADVI